MYCVLYSDPLRELVSTVLTHYSKFLPAVWDSVVVDSDWLNVVTVDQA